MIKEIRPNNLQIIIIKAPSKNNSPSCCPYSPNIVSLKPIILSIGFTILIKKFDKKNKKMTDESILLNKNLKIKLNNKYSKQINNNVKKKKLTNTFLLETKADSLAIV